MPRSLTLFTGQWADLPIAKLAPIARQMGYEGLELACWGDHFDVDAAASPAQYRQKLWEILTENQLTCFAVSNHLVGQAVCDLIDERHKAILPPSAMWMPSGRASLPPSTVDRRRYSPTSRNSSRKVE
jgi:sugar phosphate isomerase/epimerase